MRPIEGFLRREQRRILIYRTIESTFVGLSLFLCGLELAFFTRYLLLGTTLGSRVSSTLGFFLGLLSFVAATVFIFRQYRSNRRYWSLVRSAEQIESENIFFRERPELRSELRSVAGFLESRSSGEFERAHLQVWDAELSRFMHPLRIGSSFWLSGCLMLILLFCSGGLLKYSSYSLPTRVEAWVPGTYEILLPYPGARWDSQTGALTGVSGARIRFRPPTSSLLRYFLYVQTRQDAKTSSVWQMYSCGDYCELKLAERGQYSVGTLFSRSSLFPLQVFPDEPPRSVLLARVGEELLPSATLDVLNKKDIQFEGTASDDIQLRKIELYHRTNDDSQVRDEKIREWVVAGTHTKLDFSIPLVGWKGGKHEVFLRAYDWTQSADSGSVVILYADESTLREKRVQDVRALLDEWVKVLAGLLDTQTTRNLPEDFIKHLTSITYPQVDESSLLTAFVKELKSLSHRIEGWARFGEGFSELPSLISRTEREILYGLSLIFQEKTGDLETTSRSLENQQQDLAKLLEDIRSGKISADSKALDESFKALADKLAELQKKIRELPQGPSEDLLNREALDKQVDESEGLQSRIEAIKKQMQSGDKKGALRELESLLNQLSILGKEMERSLDQWKSNLNSGSMQSSEKFTKKLQDIKKKQDELAQKTSETKKKMEALDKESEKTWKPIDAKKLKPLQKDYSDLQKKEADLKAQLKKATDEFDQEVKGSEWEQVFRSNDAKELEDSAAEQMSDASESLLHQKGAEALSTQNEASETLRKAIANQQKLREEIGKAQNKEAVGQKDNMKSKEKIEILSSEKKDEVDRRKKIMESLKKKVDDRYQKSHEQYFEELLQR